MPTHIRRRLKARTNLSNDDGTLQLELPRSGFISQLSIFFEWTNGGTSNKDQDVYDAIDEIQIIANGSHELYSLTGHQARLWSHIHLGRRPFYIRDESPDVVQQAHIVIPFGCGPYDLNHYLDCGAFTDLELRIRYSPDIGATDFLTGTGYYTVYADMWLQGAPGPFGGYLRNTEQKFFTTAASGDEEIELPIRWPVLGVGIFCYEGGVAPEANITDVELNAEDGGLILVRGAFDDLQTRMHELLKVDPTEWGIVFKSDTDTIESRLGDAAVIMKDRIQSLTIGVTDQIHDIFSGYNAAQAVLQTLERDAASAAADAAGVTDGQVKWIGVPEHGLGCMLVLPFGYQDCPDCALDAPSFTRLKLILTQGNAGAECRVSLLQLAGM